MGFGIGSKKSSSSTIVNNTSQNAGFTEVTGMATSLQGSSNQVGTGNVKLGVSAGKRSTNFNNIKVETSDHGAIDRAFNFAETAANNSSRAVTESIGAALESAKVESENLVGQLKTVAVYAITGFVLWKVFGAVKQ